MRLSGRTFVATIVAWLALVPGTVSTAPMLTALVPTQGPARSLVAVEGTSGETTRVIWDAGTPGAHVIATNLGATMFSVPHDATPGTHAVAIEDDSGRSAAMTFMVSGPPPNTATPRIDHVMVLDAQFNDGSVLSVLYVQGANFDVGAVVEIDGSPVATVAHKAIIEDLYGVPPSAFDYPIDHYISLVAVPDSKPAGASVSVVVRNADNVPSSAEPYTLPMSAVTLDSDGDSLPDAWESVGHDQNDDGTNDADPYRRDLFVELDVMDGLRYPIDPSSFNAVRDMFRAAPMLNPFSGNGINLMLDTSGSVPSWDTVIFDRDGADGNPPDHVNTEAFSALKAAHFDHKSLGDVYHYVIWAKRQLGGGSGQSDAPWPVPDLQPGDDAIISLDDLPASFQSPRSQAEILAHELGHNLGQKHGGATYELYNPNYFSAMSYAWALRTGATIIKRRSWVTCLPFYYAQPDADEPGNNVPATLNMRVDYSAGMAAEVNEDALDETKGVCAHTVDWNKDGFEDGEGNPSIFALDANHNTVKHEKFKDFANWRSLLFDGPVKNGTISDVAP